MVKKLTITGNRKGRKRFRIDKPWFDWVRTVVLDYGKSLNWVKFGPKFCGEVKTALWEMLNTFLIKVLEAFIGNKLEVL